MDQVTRWTGVLLVFAGVGVWGQGAADAGRGGEAKTYEIKLERGFQKGDAFKVSMTHTQKQTQKVDLADGSGNTSDSSRVVKLEGEMRVLAVDEKGKDTSVQLVVKQLTVKTGEEGAVEVLKAGTEVEITRVPGGVGYTGKGGGALPDEAKAALAQFFKARGVTSVSEDERYGSAAPRRLGETWDGNVEVIAGAGAQQLDPKKMTAKVTLKGVKTISGVEAMQVEIGLTVKGVPDASGRPTESTLTATVAHDLPTDVTKASLGSTARSVMHLVAEQPGLRGVSRTTVDSDRTDTAVYVPMK